MARVRALASAAALVAGLVVPVFTATSASAHGWITDPPSRQDYCADGSTSFDCGPIKYEPQSVEAQKGSFQCSGGNAEYVVLDDDSKPWPRKTIGNNITVQWQITARHSTSSFEFFLDGSHTPFKTVPYSGQPSATETQTLTDLPNGNHTILARWNVADTSNAFYSCFDVNVNGTGEPTDGSGSDDQPGDDPADACVATEWSATSIYNGGDTVTYDGRTYQAKWWTTGDEPDTTGQWGVWEDQGACGDTGDSGTSPGDTGDSGTSPGDTGDSGTSPGDTDDSGTSPGDTGSGETGDTCTADVYDDGAVYTGGDLVSYQGHTWKASWWTQGTAPKDTGPWGNWVDQGECAGPGDSNGDSPGNDDTDTDSPGSDSDDPDQQEPDPGSEPGDYVVGYFTDWGIYQRDYQVKDIVTSGSADKLTHIMYAFGNVTNGRCTVGDPYADFQKTYTAADSVDGTADTWDQTLRGNFNQLRELKAEYPNIKILWSFGGWTWSGGFGHAAANADAFASSCYDLIHDSRWDGLFDGIDIDWEYPNDCGLTCDTSGPDALPTLLSSLRSAFGDDFLITAAISADGTDGGKLDQADYGTAAHYVDFFDPMTYDYFGAWDKKGPTAPHSPLSSYSGMPINGFDTTTTIAKLESLGIPSDKLLMGIGFYGRGWTGVTQAAPGGSATGAAPGTYEAGIEDYKVLKNTCPITGQVADTNYAKCGSQWWSYDDPATIAGKMAKAKDWGLAGAFVWELSGDTGNGELINAVSNGLQ